VALEYDRKVASPDASVSAGSFDASGRSLPAELLPREIAYNPVRFSLAPADTFNAVVPGGQKIPLPPGTFTRLYVLAASSDGDRKATFRVGDNAVDLTVQDWSGYIGQWDNRLWTAKEEPVPPQPDMPPPAPGAPPRMRTVMEYAGLAPGYVKPAQVAWFASHRHLSDGTNDPYAYAYLYAYAIDLPAGASALTLPADDRLRILAVSVVDEAEPIRPAAPLYDALQRENNDR
jgi:alpha-mannosidase